VNQPARCDVKAFVTEWIAANSVTGGPSASEIDRLASELTAAARIRGISGGEINKVFGDIDDYLTGQFAQA